MPVTREFEFTIAHGKEKAKLTCTEMTGMAKVPMLRVHVPWPKPYGQVFIFYRINKEELFWFDLPNTTKQKTAQEIADALIKDNH